MVPHRCSWCPSMSPPSPPSPFPRTTVRVPIPSILSAGPLFYSLLTDERILVWLRCDKYKNLQVYASLVHIDIFFKVSIQKYCNGNFSGPYGSHVSIFLLLIYHNSSSSLCMYINIIIGITIIFTLIWAQIHLKFFLIWKLHFYKDRNNYEIFQKGAK